MARRSEGGRVFREVWSIARRPRPRDDVRWCDIEEWGERSRKTREIDLALSGNVDSRRRRGPHLTCRKALAIIWLAYKRHGTGETQEARGEV